MTDEKESNPLDKLPPILRQNLDRNLCVCNEVPKMKVIDAIANGATTVEMVREQTYATDGNGCCKQQVKRLIECIHAEDKEHSDGAAGTDLPKA